MCNIVAVDECKVVLNDSSNAELNTTLNYTDIPVKDHLIAPTNSFVNFSSPILDADITPHIQPTKTQIVEELNYTRTPDLVEGVTQENATAESPDVPAVDIVEPDSNVFTSSETLEESFDNLGIDLSDEGVANPATASAPPTLPQVQKESVFIRLSNRIKVSFGFCCNIITTRELAYNNFYSITQNQLLRYNKGMES